jgi:hypothetical protein
MRECFITVVEDLLIGPGEVPLDRHVLLWRSMSMNFTTVLLTTWNREHAKRVLHTNQMRFDLLLSKDASALTDQAWKVNAVTEVMSMGWPIGFYLDVDPLAVRDVLSMGTATLLLSHRVLRPSWLPSQGPPRAWEELVAFHEQQRERTADAAASGVSGTEDRPETRAIVVGGSRGEWNLANNVE